MSTRTIEETFCDVCGKAPDGDDPDFVYAMNCTDRHDVCCQCVPKVGARQLGPGQWDCPVCNGQVAAYFEKRKKEREARRNRS